MTVVIGTAGHIDHGKTTLLRALTGIDADRLPEERRRGMTIDVGYAHLLLPDDSELDFVDVPGHDRLVANMLVGAGEIDAVLLVVAADDGPRAQTLEHLELLDGLSIRDGLAVVTKTDLVEPARVAEVRAAIEQLLARTTLAGAPILAVSAERGDGLDALQAGLVALRDRVLGSVRPSGPARLAIDRTFSVRGRGAVVTGTLRGAAVSRGDVLTLLPGGASTRVREVQVHGHPVETAAGGRTALNLGGIGVDEMERGGVLTSDPGVVATDRLLVALRAPAVLGGTMRGLPADRARLRLHIGTDQVGAALGRSGREAVELAGGEVTASLRLDRPIAAAAGDPFVLRRPSPGEVAAGGRIIDPMPPRGVSRRRATSQRLIALASAVADDPTGTAAAAVRLDLHGAQPPALADDVARLAGDRALAFVGSGMASLAETRAAVAAAVRRAVTISRPDALACATAVVDRLVADGRLVRDGDRLRHPDHRPADASPDLLAAMDRLEAALTTPAPPSLAEAARAASCPPDGIRALEAAGRIVRLEPDLAWSAAAYRDLERLALERAAEQPLTPAALRDATGTSRRYVLVILEDLSRRGLLRRTATGHVVGPRAPVRAER